MSTYIRKKGISAEQKGYVQEHTNRRITENNNTDANIQTDNLLEEILYRENMNKAFKRVKSNKGAGGIDGMGVEELLPYLKVWYPKMGSTSNG